MKIDVLKLTAFGPFTDKVVDFSGSGYGLHVVYGPNEAGKSTALRALLGLLYGFGHKVEDAWFHDYSKLMVGGVLSLSDGKRLNLTRHKRRKNDLIDEDTGEPFSQSELDMILGRMGREAFEHAFGISHDSLRLGVESVLVAGGDLGHALFAATSGLNTLKQVIQKLDGQQSSLFAPRAKKARINAAIGELNQLKKSLRNASASHHQWKKMKKHVDDLRRREIEGVTRMEELTSEIHLLSRYHDALRFVSDKDMLEKEIAELGDLPDLPDGFSERRVETQVAMTQCRETRKTLEKELADIDGKLNALVYDETIIAHEKWIRDLSDSANVHIQAAVDSKALRARIYQHKESVQQAMDVLRPGLDLDGIQGLRLSKPEKGKIQRLGARGAKVEEAVENADEALRKARADLKNSHAEIRRLEQPEDTTTLAECVMRATEHGKLEERRAEVDIQLAALKEQADIDLAALGLWTGDVFELERLAVPTEETMRRFETDLSGIDQKIAHNEKDASRIQRIVKKAEKALFALIQTRRLPSVGDLRAHRELRDKGWQSVRSVWLEGAGVDDGFLQAFPGSRDLAQAYEKSVVQADDTADVLREDAEAVARVDAMTSDIQSQKASLDEIADRTKALRQDRQTLWETWVCLWEPLGIVPLPPREMIAWASKVRELRRLVSDLRGQGILKDRLQEDSHRTKSDVTAALKQIHVDVPPEISFAGVLELAKRTVQDNNELRQSRLDLERSIKAIKDDIDHNTQRKIRADAKREAWMREWAQAISKLGFTKEAHPEDVIDFILALDDIFAELEKVHDKQGRIDAMLNNRHVYAKQVSDAVENLAPDLKEAEPEAAANELNARLLQAKEKRQQYTLLEDEKKKKRTALSKEGQVLAGLEETLRLLCEDAHVDSVHRLPEMEKRVAKKVQVRDKLTAVNERLSDLASGQELESFVDHVRAHDPDELIAKKERLENEKKDVAEKQKSILRDITLAEKDLEAIGGESIAAGIAEEVEGLAAQIESDVEYYVKLKLASAILVKAMERYRQSNQSPVLSAASEYFQALTHQSFAELRADYDDKGDPVIKAKKQNGTLLTVEEMSDGSRDQLFLALRLGGLVKYIKNNGPMPFIVDDVLVHFDDERSAAALHTMGLIAEKTQIIFFTHHQHLVGLAEKTLPGKSLHIHSL